MISVFILYLILFLLRLMLSTMSTLYQKTVICFENGLDSIVYLWIVNCSQKGGYQIVNCIRDFEENGLWHLNDRQRWMCFSLREIEVIWIFVRWLDV